MRIDRRQLLRGLAATSLLGLTDAASSVLAHAGNLPPCNCSNVILHGLFFLEFQGDMLYAAAPNVTGHKYYFREHHSQPLQYRSGLVDLMFLHPGSIQIPPPPQSPFPPELLQFSRTEIGHQGPFIDSRALESCKLVLRLPKPNAIVAFRKGAVGDYVPHKVPDLTTRVAVSIDNKLKSTPPSGLALITCLQYDNDPAFTWNFYAEHHDVAVTKDQVNTALSEAGNTFESFDLQLDDLPNPNPVSCDPNSKLPSEIDTEDETSLPGLLKNAQCPNDPSVKTQAARTDGGNITIASVQVATCPQFGVNP